MPYGSTAPGPDHTDGATVRCLEEAASERPDGQLTRVLHGYTSNTSRPSTRSMGGGTLMVFNFFFEMTL